VNMVGDALTTVIARAGWSEIEVLLTRTTPDWTSLLPCGDGSFREEPVYDIGLDGTLDIHYYRQTLDLRYYQSDVDTLADLHDDAIYEQFTVTGLQTRLWRLDGIQTILIPKMRFIIAPQGGGYTTAWEVRMTGTCTTLASVFRPLDVPPDP
jgi:hypothetical protein